MGSFRLAAGTRYLHRVCNFTGSLVETVLQSLRHSCRSELTRQGTSLRVVTSDRFTFSREAVLPLQTQSQLYDSSRRAISDLKSQIARQVAQHDRRADHFCQPLHVAM